MPSLRALIVEDSPDDADLLCRELVRGGYELTSTRVDTALEMESAVDALEWDIVFSDWDMPTFSAPDALEVVKRRSLDLPFIIVSGTVGEEVAVEALRRGAHDFFVKGKLTLLSPAVARELREVAVRRDRRQMQEQLMISDRMASVGVLAAGVAHEINNPLGAVLGNLVLALRALGHIDLDQDGAGGLREVVDELRDAHEAAQRIRDVALDLRLFARSDTEARRAVDVQKVLESSIRMARNEIRHRAVLRTAFSPVPRVDANESRLGQVFLNLIMNAVQAIPEGRAEKNEISITTTLAPDGRVAVEVGDTGSGMSTEVKNDLFTPFFTTKPVGVGTGLGLSICHRIVTSFGGTITAESKVGEGSVFRVSLVAVANEEATTATPPTEIATRSPVRRGAVLAIDDEPAIGLLVSRALSKDHDVTSTTSAGEALSRIVGGDRYDVIFCDLMMPQVTGMEFYEELAMRVPEQAKRVIFLTGGAFTPAARTFLESIENLRIEKPFDVEALSAVVNDRL
jgi:signal transduction histidine kinase